MQVGVTVEWLQIGLCSVASFGVLLGILSLVLPKRSIQLYQWLMKNFNWRVEPIDEKKELHNTRALGFLMVLLSILLITALVQPRWFVLGG